MCNRNYTIQEQKLMAKIKSSRKHVCEYCGSPIADKTKLTIDHIKPFSRGGLTIESNLAICCEQCNKEKSDMTKEEYMKYIELKKLVFENSMAYKQLKELDINYRNIIKTAKATANRMNTLISEKRELEIIMRDSKVNAAEGYMLFDDFRKVLKELEEIIVTRKGLEKSSSYAKKNIKDVGQTLEELRQTIMMPIRNDLGIGSLIQKDSEVIKEIEKYIDKYSKINKEIA